MNVHVFQHVPFEGLGMIEAWLSHVGAELTYTRFYQGELPPGPENIDALIVMGGPMSVHDEALYPWLRDEKAFIAHAILRNVRVLGICLGAQLIAETLGGSVTPNREKEIGWFPITRVAGAEAYRLGACFPPQMDVFHWHGETFSCPPGAVQLLRSAGCEQQGFALGERVLGMQFHLEMSAANAREIIAHSREELIGGRFVQSEEEMLARPERFIELGPVLEQLLTAFFS